MNSLQVLIVSLYNEGLSPYEIGEKIQKNHMFVRRALKAMGVVMRNKSEAQSNGLKSGRCKSPKQKPTEDNEDIYNVEEENDHE